MASQDKLEGAIHIPSTGWDISVQDGTSTLVVTIPGGGYCFLSSAGELLDSFIDELEDQLNATMTDSFTVALSVAGLVTITNTSANNTTITWTDTEVRDILGFTATLTGATNYTAAQQAKCLWLPNVRFFTDSNAGKDAGYEESDYMASEAPDGSVYALRANSKIKQDLDWQAVCREKTWQASEVVVNESFQRFLKECIWGEAAFGQPSGPLAWYPDRTVAGTFFIYRATNPRIFRPTQARRGLATLWKIELGGLVKVP